MTRSENESSSRDFTHDGKKKEISSFLYHILAKGIFVDSVPVKKTLDILLRVIGTFSFFLFVFLFLFLLPLPLATANHGANALDWLAPTYLLEDGGMVFFSVIAP